MAEPYPYCPNCAYRMRPKFGEHPAPRRAEVSRGYRILALGGYLAFASLLLLVALAGIRLFTDAEVFIGEAEQSGVARDRNPVPLQRGSSFREVAAGSALWGLYRGGRERVVGEGPEESLVDDPFEICIHEVTNDQYYTFLRARARVSGAKVPDTLYPTYWTRRTGNGRVVHIYERDHGDEPVTSISFTSALEFCAWLWQERFDADPDIIIDLPTADEFVLSGRGDDVTRNFPWGTSLEDEGGISNLSGKLLAVDDERVGEYRGLFGLIGNAAEWVHGYDADRMPTAAGWSFEDSGVRAIWQNRKTTPFAADGFELWARGRPSPHVGLRVIVRSAPGLPEFVRVAAGAVRHNPVDPNSPLRPPLLTEDREPPVTFASLEDRVDRPFEIARTEISNHQYLAFLVDVAADLTEAEVAVLLPKSFRRSHPFADRGPEGAPIETVFRGPFGDPGKIVSLYEAGRENHPVEGVTLRQTEEYARWLGPRLRNGAQRCRLPTVAEYLRAGRGDGVDPYPWGTDPLDPRLVCAGRRDDEKRSVSLLGRLGDAAPRIVGLTGNLAEFVRDKERVLLAGGFYALPAAGCTLDSFLDAKWAYVEWQRWNETEFLEPELMGAYRLAHYAGFRVVRVADVR